MLTILELKLNNISKKLENMKKLRIVKKVDSEWIIPKIHSFLFRWELCDQLKWSSLNNVLVSHP